jgi:hypothetical protein
MIETARPLALATLKERSLFAASTGNDRLLKILSDGTEDDTSFSNMSPAQLDAELRRLIERFDAQGLIHHQFVYRHLKTGAQIDLREYEAVDDSNADLVGGQ